MSLLLLAQKVPEGPGRSAMVKFSVSLAGLFLEVFGRTPVSTLPGRCSIDMMSIN